MFPQTPSDQYQKIKELFYSAIELDVAERDVFIQKLDNDARIEVSKLIDAHEKSKDFLEDVSALDAVRDSISAYNIEKFIGQTIGKYHIVRELGKGGMGIVFLAEREDFRQQVALKLIKSGIATDKIFSRFIKEREILATLEHPNIARLIDGGITNDGIPYLVMEYVSGVSVDEYCKREKPSIETRLELFRKICASVAHAHRNLVVHRDLKPSNILITAEGEPKLLDFGIAKLFSPTSNAEETITNFQALTPEYASPEQLRGEKLTTATDVYSLGIILYELVTGKRPFETEGKNLAEVLKMVCEIEPLPPSSIFDKTASVLTPGSKNDSSETSRIRVWRKFIRGDLDNIILKSLRKEPDRRYLSVEQFSDDVRRYLVGLPVSAHTDSLTYRAKKFVQRNRGLVLANLFIILALAGGVMATLREANRADEQRLRAEQRFNEVRQLANSLISEFPQEVDKSATKAKELLVRRSLEYLDSLRQESTQDAGLQLELATAYEKIGDLQGNEYFSNLGDTEGALASYRKSLELRQSVFQRDTQNIEIRRELGRSYERIGDVLWTMDDLSAALENYRQSKKLFEEVYSAEPESPNTNSALATIYWKVGDLLGNKGFANLGDTKGALDSHRQALAIREKLVQSDPGNIKFLNALLDSYTNMANVLDATGERKEAERAFRSGLIIAQKLVDENPTSLEYQSGLSLSYLYVGKILGENGEFDQGVENQIQALKIAKKISSNDPDDVQAERNVAVIYRELGKIYEQKGDVKEALFQYRQAQVIAEKQSKSDPHNNSIQSSLSLNYTKIGDALRKANNFDEAMKNYELALNITKTLVTANPTNTKNQAMLANIYSGVGNVFLQTNNKTAALENFNQAIEIHEKLIVADKTNLLNRRELAELYNRTATIYLKSKTDKSSFIQSSKKDVITALSLLNRSFEIWKQLDQNGILKPSDTNRLNEITREIDRCNMTLAKLNYVK